MRKSYWLGGHRLTILAGPADTDGRYDLVEGWFTAGTQIPPHRHRRYSEQFYVLEGEFAVWAGKQMAVLRPGDTRPAAFDEARAVGAEDVGHLQGGPVHDSAGSSSPARRIVSSGLGATFKARVERWR